MRKKDDELTPRQIRFLSNVAQGLAVGEAAKDCGYHTHHASKLYRSPEAQAYVARLVASAENEMAAALPDLLKSALQVLKTQLTKGSPDRSLKAAAIVLKLASPLLKNLTTTDTGGFIIEQCSSHQPKEGIYHETHT